jgi:hypothetical protein
MTMEFNEIEKLLLADVLRREHNALIDEMHHTDSYDYKEQLKEKLELLKQLRTKFDSAEI